MGMLNNKHKCTIDQELYTVLLAGINTNKKKKNNNKMSSDTESVPDPEFYRNFWGCSHWTRSPMLGLQGAKTLG